MRVDTGFLNGTRFLLALWVAVGHFYILIGGTRLFNYPILSLLLSPAPAVDGFMIITGFLMTYNYILRSDKEPYHEKSTVIMFITRRLFRLYPIYCLALVSAYFLLEYMSSFRLDTLKFFTGNSMTQWGTEYVIQTPNLFELITHLTFLHGLIPSHAGSLLSVAWSLSLEMQFYLIFPFLFLFLFTTGNTQKKIFFGVVTSVIVSAVLLLRLTYGSPSMILYKLPLFLLGTILAAVSLRKLHYKYLTFSLPIIMLMQAGTTNLFIIFFLAFLFLEQLKPFTDSTSYRVLVKIKELLSNRISQIGADISYSMYLFHLILLPFVFKFFMQFNLSIVQTAAFSFVVFLTITFILSYILYNVIEKPFILVGKKFAKKMSKTTVIWSDRNQKARN